MFDKEKYFREYYQKNKEKIKKQATENIYKHIALKDEIYEKILKNRRKIYFKHREKYKQDCYNRFLKNRKSNKSIEENRSYIFDKKLFLEIEKYIFQKNIEYKKLKLKRYTKKDFAQDCWFSYSTFLQLKKCESMKWYNLFKIINFLWLDRKDYIISTIRYWWKKPSI